MLVIDGDRLLLQHAREATDPTVTYWFTPGGGVGPGETQRRAAARELAEETGMVVSESELVGPVAEHDVILPFRGTIVHQHEVFFLATPATSTTAPARTVLEQREFLELAWVRFAEMSALPDPTYPPDMPDLLAHVVPAWDGTLLTLGREDSRGTGSAGS